MNAYLTSRPNQRSALAEQQLDDEKEKWIDRAQKIIDMMQKNRPASSTSPYLLTPAHTKDFAAIKKLARPTMIFISAGCLRPGESMIKHRTGCPF